LKPPIGAHEFAQIFRFDRGKVAEYEGGFAQTFRMKYAVAYPYGRTAQWALLKALEIGGTERKYSALHRCNRL
jgi:hypothetical protein